MRAANAVGYVHLNRVLDEEDEEVESVTDDEIVLKRKGAVFQTSRIAGYHGIKSTSSLLPLCHPIGFDHADIIIKLIERRCVGNAMTMLSSSL